MYYPGKQKWGDAEDSAVATATDERQMESHRRPVVLVVDDEAILAERVKVEFEDAGFRAVVAHDGESAVRAAAQAMPDLIVLDILLPGIDGLECLQQIRDTNRHHGQASPYVLLLTGDNSPRNAEVAQKSERCSLLHKPCDYAFLVRLARMLIGAD